MPISFTSTAGGTGYIDVRVGTGHGIHQRLLDATALAASRDADGNLPPGLGITVAGGPAHASGTAVAVIGPEPVKLGSANVFGNTIETGLLNGDAIADNVGAALAATLPAALRLI